MARKGRFLAMVLLVGQIMLKKVHVENYKCLWDTTVELGDFNVLIGPNDSGKSSFLEVIKFLGRITKENVFQGDWSFENVVWRRDDSRKIVWEIEGQAPGIESFRYHVEFTSGKYSEKLTEEMVVDDNVFWDDKNAGVRPPGFPTVFGRILGGDIIPSIQSNNGGPPNIEKLKALASSLTTSEEYQFQIKQMAKGSVLGHFFLNQTGANLASVLDSLQNSPKRTNFDLIQKKLQDVIPTLAGVILPTVGEKGKVIEFILSGDGQKPVSIPASLVSGGALLVTAFLTLAYTETSGILLIEEPENGLHPGLLKFIIDLLRKMSTGEIGNRKRQILVTTHSPLLLNYVKPEEVKIFRRDPESGTEVTSMDKVTDDNLLEEFAVGELWYLLGEDKLVERVKP